MGFDINSGLENHIKVNHENHKVFKCDKCDKCFVLNWRRDKHMKLHTNASVKPCHYFNNGGKCPFEELGCKFLHIEAKLCKSGVKCLRRLCPHRHPEKEVDTDCNVGEDILDETEKTDTNDTSTDDNFFLTSTPQKVEYQCDECTKKDQCTDCFVRQTMEDVNVHKRRRVHF